MDEPPVDRLLREKEDEAIEKFEDALEFLSPDRNSTSKLIVDGVEKKLHIETILHHNMRMIDQNIYLSSNILSGKFTEDQIREIIDDISARLRVIELPKMLQKIQYGFKIVNQDDEYTKFSYSISYDKDDMSYDILSTEFETVLMNSFELVYGFLMKIGFFIQAELNQFLVQPDVELKLLEIRKLLFQAKFYATMTGRFANDQRRIALSMKKEAIELINKFEGEYSDIASEKLEGIRDFFKLQFY
ncbi:MAG: hypothetical protein HWN66_05260 [Candidatus Helarchaeota archaeon]|nr:hypothetical protein [Candidatus Helarchaeota archaeon]